MIEHNLAYKILRVLLYAALFTPLWIWSGFLFPFITTKILYFRVLIELAVIFYVPLALRYPEIRPRRNWLLWAVWIYVAVAFVASIFGVDFRTSFWGTIERGEGLVSLLHFAVYFTMLVAVWRTREAWSRYLLAAVGVTGLVGLYSLGQIFNWSFVISSTGSRLSGTIGNAAFFAAFMLFGIFWSVYLWFDAQKLSLKVFLAAAAIFESVLLYASQTRGAILALGIVLLVYFAVIFFKTQARRAKWIALILLLVVVGVSGFIYLNRSQPWVKANHTLQRLVSISLSDVTTQSRLATWRTSWQAWRERPVLGYGYENYHLAFNKYFPPQIYRNEGSQIWFDRAHNIIFDVGVTSGVVGLLAYLTILGLAGFIILKLFRRQSGSWPQPVVLGTLLLAYFIQNLFVFDTQATYLMFFILLAHLVFLHHADRGLPANDPEQKTYHPGIVLPGLVVVAMVAVLYLVNIRPALANYQATAAIKLAQAGLATEVKPAFARALSHGTYMDQEIRQRLVDYGYVAINSGQLTDAERQDFYQYMISEFQKSLAESPRDVKNYLYLMNVDNRVADQESLAQIFALGQQAIALSPTRPQIYFELGQAYFSKREFGPGLEQFAKAVALAPLPKLPHMNYLLAAIIAHQPQRVAEQTAVLTEQLQYQFTADDYQSIAQAYLQAGDVPQAVAFYRQALALAPDNQDLHARLAVVFGQACQILQAQAEVDAVVRLNSAFTLQGKEFMSQVEKKCQK